MTWTLRHRPLAGAPMMSEYACIDCGTFERLVQRNDQGDPPEHAKCDCGWRGDLVLSAPQIKQWSRPAYATVRGGDDERRPGMLDTRKLADAGPKEWKAAQDKLREDRTHHKLIKAGLKQPRVQSK